MYRNTKNGCAMSFAGLASLQSALEELNITPRGVMTLFMQFDKTDTGAVSLRAFADGLTESWATPGRRKLIATVFELLDVQKKGSVDVMHLVGVFRADLHADVLSHRKTRGQLLAEVLAAFDGQESVFLNEFWSYNR